MSEAQTQDKDTLLDLEGMMNETLDSIQEAPDFVTPPPGEYRIICTDAKVDKYKDKATGSARQRLKISYAVEETLATLNNEPPVPNGSIFTETFQGTEQGLSFFKKRIREIMAADSVDGVTIADMMNSVKGQSFYARLSIRKTEGSGDNKGKTYENLTIRILPEADIKKAIEARAAA